jgi:hypothetical protein
MKATYAAIILCIFLSLPQAEAGSEQLQAYCEANHGEMLDQWTCPSSGDVRKGDFCAVKTSTDKVLMTNGCTGTVGGIGSQFLRACVLHDFCYHDEPAVSGKEKADCDQKLLSDMEDICVERGGDYLCFFEARAFYDIVKMFGEKSWECSKNNVPYPSSVQEIIEGTPKASPFLKVESGELFRNYD